MYRSVGIVLAISIGAALPPVFMGGSIDLNVYAPAVVFVAFLVTVAFAFDYGVPGALLAPPLTFAYYLAIGVLFRFWIIPVPQALSALGIELIAGIYIGNLRDLGRKLRLNELRFRALTVDRSDLVLIVDEHLQATYASDSFLKYLGETPSSLLGSGYERLFDPRETAFRRETFQRVWSACGSSERFELTLHAADGRALVYDVSATNHLDEPAVRGVVLSGRDITERKKTEALLTTQAFHDNLTGLPNRAYFLGSHEREIARTEEGAQVAVLFIDLDDFKPINDTFGHQAGDQLLREIAHRIDACVRPAGMTARLSGDEFAVLLPDYTAEEAKFLAKRIAADVKAPVELCGRMVSVCASIGAAATAEPIDSSTLLDRADASMYAAKRRYSGAAKPGAAQVKSLRS